VTAKLDRVTVETGMAPTRVDVDVLVPDGGDDVLLLYLLHGGEGGEGFLEKMAPGVQAAIEGGALPPAVVATPLCGRSLYMDFEDGSQRWESVLTGPVLEQLRQRFGIPPVRERFAMVGVSMGGMGALRISFKHPELAAVVAALEPGIEPAFAFADIALEDRFWRSDDLFEEIYGRPVSEAHWQANNPASIARDDPDRLRQSGLAIYLECGDRDAFGLHRGTEFLHRVLYDAGVSHEYRLVRGADHLGRTLGPRFADAFAFVGRALRPEPADAQVDALRRFVGRLRAKAGLRADA
jgi:S-formylglutathione hydrolase